MDIRICEDPNEMLLEIGTWPPEHAATAMAAVEFRRPQDILFAAYEGTDLVGVAALNAKPGYVLGAGNFLTLEYLAVKQGGTGKGQAMFEAMRKIARQVGYGLFVKSRPQSLTFYQKMGMTQIPHSHYFYIQ